MAEPTTIVLVVYSLAGPGETMSVLECESTDAAHAEGERQCVEAEESGLDEMQYVVTYLHKLKKENS